MSGDDDDVHYYERMKCFYCQTIIGPDPHPNHRDMIYYHSITTQSWDKAMPELRPTMLKEVYFHLECLWAMAGEPLSKELTHWDEVKITP